MRKIILLVAVFVLLASGVWAYDETTVSNGGTIKGKITYDGKVPTRKIVPTKDTEVCGGVRDKDLIEVGSDNGVKNAVIFLKDVEKGKAWGKSGQVVTPVLDNTKCRFEPHVQVARVGTDVTVKNSDPVLHNTHAFLGRRTVFNIALPIEGMSVDKPLRRPGLVRVECDAHGWMLAWMYVLENPYFSVSAEDGSYTISDVPPGTYTLVVWQEEKGELEQQVTVEAGKTVSLDIELK